MLSDRIWITRKARINTEKRLQSSSFLSEALMTSYSLLLVALSIWNFAKPDANVNMLLILSSVGVLALSIFLSAQKFKDRALSMRNCYVRLDELYLKAKRAEDAKNQEEIERLETSYHDILLMSENHSDFDFLCMRYSLRKDQNITTSPFTTTDYINFIFQKLGRSFCNIFYFLIPFILMILWNLCKL